MRIKSIKKLKKYKSFAKAGLLSTLNYRASLISWIVAQTIGIIITCFLWYAIFNQADDALYEMNPFGQRVLNGFTLPQMITYLLVGMVTSNLVQSTQSYMIVADDIKEGNIAMQLIKPINYRLRCLSSSFGSFISFFLIFFIPLFSVIIVVVGLMFGFDNLFFSFSWYNIPFFLISVLLSFLLQDSIHFAISQLIFHTGASFGLFLLTSAILQFLSGSLIPFSFFPSWAQSVLTYLPFAGLLSTPNLIIMGQYTVTDALIALALQVGWLCIFSLIASLAFKRSLKHVISFGG